MTHTHKKKSHLLLRRGTTLSILNARVRARRFRRGFTLRLEKDLVLVFVTQILWTLWGQILPGQRNGSHHDGIWLLLWRCIWYRFLPGWRNWGCWCECSGAGVIKRLVSFQTGLAGLAWLLNRRLRGRDCVREELQVWHVLLNVNVFNLQL